MREGVRDNIEDYKKYNKKQFDREPNPRTLKLERRFGSKSNQFQTHIPIPKKLQQKYVDPYYITTKIGESTYRLRSCETNEPYKTPCHVEKL